MHLYVKSCVALVVLLSYVWRILKVTFLFHWHRSGTKSPCTLDAWLDACTQGVFWFHHLEWSLWTHTITCLTLSYWFWHALLLPMHIHDWEFGFFAWLVCCLLDCCSSSFCMMMCGHWGFVFMVDSTIFLVMSGCLLYDLSSSRLLFCCWLFSFVTLRGTSMSGFV